MKSRISPDEASSPDRFLVHVHVFYPQFWPELKEKLSVLTPHSWDLYVTMVERHEDIIQDILKMKPDAHIDIIENRGYDVAPFLHVLSQVDLNEYDFCIKLHTKQSFMPQHCKARRSSFHEYRSLSKPYRRNGDAWRKALLTFLQPHTFTKCIESFHKHPNLGMVGDHRFILRRGIEGEAVATNGAQDILKKLGLPLQQPEWISGTMFICRASLLTPIQQLHLQPQDFPVPDKEHKISLPHMIEVALGSVIVAQGYSIRDVYTPYICRLARRLASYISIFMRNHVLIIKNTTKGGLIVKFCKIPIYYKKDKAK